MYKKNDTSKAVSQKESGGASRSPPGSPAANPACGQQSLSPTVKRLGVGRALEVTTGCRVLRELCGGKSSSL